MVLVAGGGVEWSGVGLTGGNVVVDLGLVSYGLRDAGTVRCGAVWCDRMAVRMNVQVKTIQRKAGLLAVVLSVRKYEVLGAAALLWLLTIYHQKFIAVAMIVPSLYSTP